MEVLTIESDIQVIFIKAEKFPDDVPATYTLIEQVISDKTERRYFGYSQPDKNGVIVHKA